MQELLTRLYPRLKELSAIEQPETEVESPEVEEPEAPEAPEVEANESKSFYRVVPNFQAQLLMTIRLKRKS